MKRRCLDKTHESFPYYGGKGIKICDAWIVSFEQFLSDVGVRPSEKHTLERINVRGNYEPGNVKWLLSNLQQRNKSNTKLPITYRGETHTITEWASITKIPKHRLYMRLKLRWNIEDILTVLCIRGRGKTRYGHTTL